MPDLRLSEVHLPELHLPEMTREDIVRAVGDARRDIDLSRLDPRRFELPESARSRVETAKVEMAKVDLSKVDVPKAIATATQAAALVRRTRRPRLPLLVGGVVALGLIGFALLTSPMVRPKLDEAARKARARIDAMREAREGDVEELDLDVDVVAVPIEPDAFLGSSAEATASAGDGFEAPADAAARATDAVAEDAGTLQPVAEAASEPTPA